MKILTRFICFLLLAGFLNSCSEDFQLTEPYKDIPVIYGLLNRADTAHYIRIQKAFVDENIASTQLAKNPDSIYYPNPTVKLVNELTKQEFLLSKVDGNLEGLVRQNGPFATSPNYLYKILSKDINLKGGDKITLQLLRGDGKAPVTATIILVGDISFTFPDDNTRQLKIFYESSYLFGWKHQSNTSVFDLKALVSIDELNIVTQKVETKIIEIPFAKSFPGKTGSSTNISSTKVLGSTLYNFLHDQLTVDPSIERYINKLDFYLTGGGPEIQNYLNIINANTGITASQEIPRYTNLSEGFGIFSSAVTIKKTITLQNPTIDSLQMHPLTRDLNFK
ncbi:MAG: hypothetical protein WAR77_02395 [Saprospiraceae bacterium]|nr:DUF4249 family protein [Saprospiraceae bacterium]